VQLLGVFGVGDPVVAADFYVRAFHVRPVFFRQHNERRRAIIFPMFADALPRLQNFGGRLAHQINENQIGAHLPARQPVERVFFVHCQQQAVAVFL
jgi:hypothetical protein